jgi:hypothetical protein
MTPLSWALRAIMVNELTSPPWQTPLPYADGMSVGQYSLQVKLAAGN